MNGFKLKIISLFVRSNDVSLHSSDPDIGFLGLFIFFFHFFFFHQFYLGAGKFCIQPVCFYCPVVKNCGLSCS